MADIYWVADTVNADNVGTVDTYADPYGIQAAFDNVAAGDEIRIVAGANNYDSNSNSWTNRDAADKQINVDTTAGTATAPVWVRGYTNETTEGLATLDFEKAGIVGANGFACTVGYYLWKNIRVTEAETDGWDTSGAGINHMLYLCRADNNGAAGIDASSPTVQAVSCQFDTNGSDGSQMLCGLILCECNDNTGDGHGLGSDNVTHVFCLFDGNTVLGSTHDDNVVYVNCTFEDNDDGLSITSGAIFPILINCAFTNNDDYGIDGGSGYVPLELNCGYFGNTTGLTNLAGIGEQESRVTTDPQYVGAGSRNYALGTNWKAAGAGGFLSGASTGYIDVGALQRVEAGGALTFIETRRNTLIGR